MHAIEHITGIYRAYKQTFSGMKQERRGRTKCDGNTDVLIVVVVVAMKQITEYFSL